MNMLKRTLAFVLTLTMLLSLGEGFAFASETAGDGTAAPPTVADSEDPMNPGSRQAPVEGEVTDDETTGGEVTDDGTTDGEAAEPSTEPSAEPSAEPSTEPSAEPSVEPSTEPTEEPQAEPVHKQWPWTEPGNSTSSLMHGGVNLNSANGYYYFENGGLYLDGTLLAGVDGYDLNLSDGWLYYTVGNTVYRIPAGGGSPETVHTAEGTIDQMYVMGQEIRYLSGGRLWSFDMGWTEPEAAPAPTEEEQQDVPDTVDAPDTIAAPVGGFSFDMGELGLTATDDADAEAETASAAGPLEQLDAPEGTVKFIPTAYGNLFFTGTIFYYTLWAGMTQLYGTIEDAYIDEGWLVVVTGGETYQAAVEPMFQGSFALEAYSLHQDMLVQNGLSEEEQLANEHAYAESAEYAAVDAALEPYSDSGIATVSTSAFLTKPLSTSQQNIVLRARQMASVTWSPKADRWAWGGDNVSYRTSNGTKDIYKDGGKFKAGTTYTGVPYSWPVGFGYVGWDVSLQTFLSAVNNPSSVFNTQYSTITRTAPYYGSDCSGFASYCWDLPYRCTCTSMLDFSQCIGKQISQLQVGDVINNPNSHVLVVTDIGYNVNGEIVAVEITEQTPPMMRVTCYAKDRDYIAGKSGLINGNGYTNKNGLNGLQWYLDNGYAIYRRACNSKPTVSAPSASNTYKEDDILSVPAPTITVAAGDPGKANVTLEQKDNDEIWYTKDGTAPAKSGKTSTQYVSAFEVDMATDGGKGSDSEGKIIVSAVAVAKNSKQSVPATKELISAQAPTLAVKAGWEGKGSGVLLSDGKYYVDEDATALTLQSEAGATVYYTTDESSPADPTLANTTETNGKAGEVSIDISDKDNITIKAFAWADGRASSGVAEFQVEKKTLHSITVTDPAGLVTVDKNVVGGKVQGDGQDVQVNTINDGVLMVEDSTESLVLKLGKDKSKIASLKVDDVEELENVEDVGKGDNLTYTFKSVIEDHTVEVKVNSGFSDITEDTDDWIAEAVSYCTAHDLMKGSGADTFGVDTAGSTTKNRMTRADLVTVLGRMIKPSIKMAHNTEKTRDFETQADWEKTLSTTTLAKTLVEDVKLRTSTAVKDDAPDNLLRDGQSNVLEVKAAGQYLQVGEINWVNGTPWYKVWVLGKASGGSETTFSGWCSAAYNGSTAVFASHFDDLGKRPYASAYTQWAYLNNIILGISNTKFEPLQYISRQDICVILHNYLTEYLGVDLDENTPSESIKDLGDVSGYAKKAVNAMINLGIIKGNNNKSGTYFYPGNYAKRVEVATMIMRLDQYVKSHNLDMVGKEA